jgi:hypothetical protein
LEAQQRRHGENRQQQTGVRREGRKSFLHQPIIDAKNKKSRTRRLST